MFYVYEGKYKLTDNPVSYNHLQTMFKSVSVPWSKVSILPCGEFVQIGEFKIVRAL